MLGSGFQILGPRECKKKKGNEKSYGFCMEG